MSNAGRLSCFCCFRRRGSEREGAAYTSGSFPKRQCFKLRGPGFAAQGRALRRSWASNLSGCFCEGSGAWRPIGRSFASSATRQGLSWLGLRTTRRLESNCASNRKSGSNGSFDAPFVLSQLKARESFLQQTPLSALERFRSLIFVRSTLLRYHGARERQQRKCADRDKSRKP